MEPVVEFNNTKLGLDPKRGAAADKQWQRERKERMLEAAPKVLAKYNIEPPSADLLEKIKFTLGLERRAKVDLCRAAMYGQLVQGPADALQKIHWNLNGLREEAGEMLCQKMNELEKEVAALREAHKAFYYGRELE